MSLTRFRTLFLSLLLVVTLAGPRGSVFALELPGKGGQNAQTAASDPTPLVSGGSSAEVIHQGYELLLDRYYQDVKPADLLNAAYAGLTKGLGNAGVAVKNPGPLALEDNRDRAWSVFAERLDTLLRESPPPTGLDVSATALLGMTKFLDEGHTAFLNPDQYQQFQAFLRGDVRYGGIGIRPKRPDVTVAEVFPSSPAEAAGIQPGDQIRVVDGQPLDGKTLEQVAQLIRGPEGSTVALEVDRPRNGEHLSFLIVRASIKVDYINTDVIQQNIGYVRLRGFPDPSVADRFEQFLDTLPAIGARGLIIDLRGNAGGRVDIGLRLLNRFISSGALMDSVDRSGRHRVQQASGPGWANPIPVAILIDEGTASMGEIFAQAMRERGVARLIGKQTSGNVAAAQVFPLTDGSALQITILEIQSGDGVKMNRVGVAPDDAFDPGPDELDQGRDPALAAAVVYVWDHSRAVVGAAP